MNHTRPLPSEVVTANPWPHGLALDADNVYWADWQDNGPGVLATGRIGKASIQGGTATILYEGPGLTGNVAVQQGTLVWTRPGEIWKMNINGGEEQLLAPAMFPGQLAVDGNWVYYTDVKAGTVNLVPLGGGAVTVLASGLNRPTDLAVRGNIVGFSEWPSDDPSVGMVKQIRRDSGAVICIATGQNKPSNLVIDGTHVLWLSDSETTVNKAPLAGGPVASVAAAPVGSRLTSFCCDDQYMYCAWRGLPGEQPGGVGRMLKGDESLESLASDQAYPERLLVNDSDIFWVSIESGTIFRLPKRVPR